MNKINDAANWDKDQAEGYAATAPKPTNQALKVMSRMRPGLANPVAVPAAAFPEDPDDALFDMRDDMPDDLIGTPWEMALRTVQSAADFLARKPWPKSNLTSQGTQFTALDSCLQSGRCANHDMHLVGAASKVRATTFCTQIGAAPGICHLCC
jgi:hypothetical protein